MLSNELELLVSNCNLKEGTESLPGSVGASVPRGMVDVGHIRKGRGPLSGIRLGKEKIRSCMERKRNHLS